MFLLYHYLWKHLYSLADFRLKMYLKQWLKWIVCFLVLGAFSVYMVHPVKMQIIPLASAYSYDEAMGKISWDSIKTNSILIYTGHSDFIGRDFGNGEFVIWQPAQDNFKKFITKYCHTFEKVSQQGKTVYIFKETGDECINPHAFDALDSEVKGAFNNLRAKELRNTVGGHQVIFTPGFVS